MKTLSVPTTMDSYGKINVTLRITGRRDDGYHRLHSLFLRTAPLERLTISRLNRDNVNDTLEITGQKLEGVNILQVILTELRKKGVGVPPLHFKLEKTIPPGTGLGCGSGNGAVLFQWLRRQGWNADFLAPRIGADIPFFLQKAPLAFVSGIGDLVEPLTDRLDVKVMLVIPRWRCETRTMFRLFDENDGCQFNGQAAQIEARDILLRLTRGQPVGLLPNDFAPLLMQAHSEYENLYRWYAEQGALAWGISGSGSAAFALWPQEKALTMPTFEWIDSTMVFSTRKESC